MFLTEVVGSTNSRILRYNLDGSYRRVLIDTKLQRPSGIALDPINRRIYWTDKSRDTVESSDYEGRGRYESSPHYPVDMLDIFVGPQKVK